MSNFENRVQKDLVTESVFTESNEEFILPDYMPEIGRVLRLSATLLPEEHFAGSDGVEFSGRVEYRLLYSNGAGEITEAPLEGRYRYRVPNGERATACYTEERIESMGARPTAPRKLSIRTRVCARPHLLYEEAVGATLTDMLGDAPAEAIQREAFLLERSVSSSGLLHKEERFTVEDCSPESLTLISLQSALLPEATVAHDGYLSVRGKLVFTLLLKKGDDTPFVKLCTVPFEEEITAEDARAEDAVTLSAFCGAPAVAFESEGENTALLLDAEYSLFCVLSRNRSFSYLEDLYAHGERHEILRKPFSAESLVGAAMGNFSVGDEVPLPADFKGEGTLVPHFSLKEAETVHQGERAVIEGKLAVLLLSFFGGESDRCELTLPFRVELPIGKAGKEGDAISFSVVPTLGSAQATSEGVRLSTELSCAVCVLRPVSLSLPERALSLGEVPSPDATTVTIYYPTDEDSLWSVGKRYAVSIASLKEQNGIPEDEDAALDLTKSLDGYAYLFVGGL